MNRGKQIRSALVYVVLVLLLVWSFTAFRSAQQQNFIPYSQVRTYFLEQQVNAFQVEDNKTLILKLKNGDTRYHRLADVELFYNDLGDEIAQQQEEGVLQEFNLQPAYEMPLWLQITIPIVGTVVVVMVIWGVMAMRQQNAQGGQGGLNRFGKARIVQGDGTVHVTFADVAGAEEEKAELQELVDFLRNPQKYMDLGARIPKGVLLVGPPGTGKTLLAKAVAGEAGVKFLSISGSDFVELYVGVGASRVRDLFDEAKKAAPAIVFIDEIDAVGRQRGAGLGGGHDEREQTLNQLLVEMDGFAANEGVIVLAATNRQDILDPALLRPGRFDRQVYVGRPDMKGREEILKVHARRKPLAEDVDLREVARETTGFTGADLENLMNEAALLAARKNQPFLTLRDIQESVIKVIAGPEKKSRAQLEEDRRITAYHEAGHAVVSHALSTQDPVHQITIIPRGQAAGMTINRPQEDRGHVSRQQLCETLCTLLGGRAAEAHALGFVCTGAISDLQRASAIARDMVTKYGMSEKLGLVTFSSEHDEVFIGRSMAQAKPYSEETAALIDGEVKNLLDQAYAQCQEILKRDNDKLELVARYLLAFETMDADTFQMVYDDPQALARQISPEEVENNG
ncbi:ATP-dependent zinc metalloprotease FtsH [Pseudoflavonifractor capillosus]|uniref:ATP-dependent zinc metalloprotease FtsH n=1 Tax=Pseudoflavonifractor capillosus TaxID=106588 RepID=UPI001FB01456|nr:ATP-dependent zinc metalloprotease FtsH [Pseudoflavonifractor capillosus]